MANREKGVIPSNPEEAVRVSRRATLHMLGTALAVTPLTAALGCSDGERSANMSTEGAMAPSTAKPASSNSGSQAADPAAVSGAANPARAGTSQASQAAASTGQAAGGAPSTVGMPTATPSAGQSASSQASAGQGATSQSMGPATAAGQAGASAAGASASPAQVDGWAMGGTATIAANPSTYPSPFGSQMDSSCVRTEAMTLGPCHDDQAPEREDISEGRPGLPIRFGLRVVNEKCEPIANANIDVWHCDADGIYSSKTSDFASYCTSDKAEAQPARWFRGYRQVDETGTVWFNTCFPGWYPSRAIHFHVTVRRSSRQGMEALTTQLAFDLKLTDEICTTHPDYKKHGKPDTTNMVDNTFVGSSYVLETKRMPDGVMLAWKTLVIPS